MARSSAGRSSTMAVALLAIAFIVATAVMATLWRIEQKRGDLLERSLARQMSLRAVTTPPPSERADDPPSADDAPAVVLTIEAGGTDGTVRVSVDDRTFSCGAGADDAGWRSVTAAARGARDTLRDAQAEGSPVAGRIAASQEIDAQSVARAVDLLIELGCQDISFVGTSPRPAGAPSKPR